MKILKETETEEKIVFFVTFLSLIGFQLEGPWSPAPPATPMVEKAKKTLLNTYKCVVYYFVLLNYFFHAKDGMILYRS